MDAVTPTLGEVARRFGAALTRVHRLTDAQRAVLSALCVCRTAALGGHLYRCDGCGHEHPVYNGCRDRHCPSCLAHRSATWLRERTAELLPVPYFHVVFTVPDEVAALGLGNKTEVYSILFRAASETLLEVGATPEHLGARLGFLAVLHTWTQTLLFHPHVHCIVPGGWLSEGGQTWVASRPDYLLPIQVLSALYRGKFLAYLAASRAAGRLRFGGSTAALAEDGAWKDFLAKQWAKGWVVYAKPPFGSPEQVLKYLARYTHRVALSNRRLLGMNDETVTFQYRDRSDGGRQRTMTLPGAELLRRFLLHVLPAGFVRIRYFGFLANGVRRKCLARCRELLGAAPPEPASTEAEREPERPCPRCQRGVLRWVASLPRTTDGRADGGPVPRDTS